MWVLVSLGGEARPWGDLGHKVICEIAFRLVQPDTRAKLESAGVSLFQDNQANFDRYYHSEIAKWRNVVKNANLKLE